MTSKGRQRHDKAQSGKRALKREYFRYLAEARGRDAATIDGVAKSIARFEESAKWRDFKRFHREQAVAFKAKLAAAANERTGDRLSKATILATLRDLRSFFFWLAHLPGYKSHVAYADADYFNLSDKDVAIARARREKRVPTLAQVEHVLSTMPAGTLVERRNRALIAFAAVTGARVAALTSFRHEDLNIAEGYVDQDARHVLTKFAKSFRTYLMPVSELALTIVEKWHAELGADPTRGPADPLFASTEIGLNDAGVFAPMGLSRKAWSTSSPVREIFRSAFESAGLSYFNPHSFRDMLVRHAMMLNLPPEAMKAWSQNLGHNEVLTTFTSYGTVPAHRQAALIKGAASRSGSTVLDDPDVLALIAAIQAKAA